MANKTNFNGFSISWKYNGVVYNDSWKMRVYAYTVTVKNDATGKKTRFRYYEGTGNKEGQIKWYNALYSFLSDGASYENARDFWDFCDEFGYSYDRDAKRIFDACKSAYNRMTRILNGVDFFEFYDEFMEVYGDEC